MAPKLFAPNPFIGGTSITHVDDATYPNDLMNSAISPGEIKQTPSAIDRGILRDLGWDISVSSATVTWTGAGTGNHLSNFANLLFSSLHSRRRGFDLPIMPRALSTFAWTCRSISSNASPSPSLRRPTPCASILPSVTT